MRLSLPSILFAAGLFVGMVVLLELGRKMGRSRLGRDEEGARAGLGAVEGAIFALMGLLVAFTFSGAAARFDSRRQTIIDEANAIGTAWLRIDLLPGTVQPEFRDIFRRYVDCRLEVYKKIPDMTAVQTEIARGNQMQSQIWERAVAAVRDHPNPVTPLVIASLNEMFDIAASRDSTAQIHPPMVIFIMLGVLALMSALLAGYAMAGGKSRSWIHIVGYALILSLTVYVILDLEFPRLGFIRIDSFDHILVELRQSMK